MSHIITPEDDSIPRVRWNDTDHRFHYTVPVGEQPGKKGFVILHEMEPTESDAILSPRDKVKFEDMKAANNAIHDLEIAKKYRDTIKFLEHKRSNHKSNKELYDERTTSQSDTITNQAMMHEKKPISKQHITKTPPAIAQQRHLKQPKNLNCNKQLL